MWILHQVRHRLSNCKTPLSCQLKSGGCTNVTEYIDTTCSAAEEAAVTGCRCGLLQSVVGCDDQSLPDQQSSLDRCKERGCKLCKSICPQTILVIVNFVFLMCGWALVAIGLWLHINQDSIVYTYLLRDDLAGSESVGFDKIPFVLVWLGFFVSGVSFLGCCGACVESVCFLGFYSLLLVVVIITEIVIGSLSSQFSEQLTSKMSRTMYYQLTNNYNKTARNTNATKLEVLKVTRAWDAIQSELQCCGVKGPQDYTQTSWFNHTDDTDGVFVPISCCVIRNDDDILRWSDVSKDENYCQIHAILYPQRLNHSENLFTQGCHRMVVDSLYSHSGQMHLLLSALVIVQILDLVLACSLINWVRKKQSDYWWCDEEDDFQ